MMNKKEIFKKVGGIITELNEQYEYLSQSPENLNDLELELFSANANFLSDHISILVKLNDNSAKPSTAQPVKQESVQQPAEIKSEERADEKPAVEEPREEEKPEIPSWRFELEKGHVEQNDSDDSAEEETEEEQSEEPVAENTQEEETSEEEKLEEPAQEPEEEQEPEREEAEVEEPEAPEEEEDHHSEVKEEKPEVKAEEKPASEPNTVAESIVKEVVISERTVALPIEQTTSEGPAPTLNDLLSKNAPQQTIGSQFNSRQVKDLKSMISLNDKLLFVRDLFNGYSLAYSEAIELLNRFDRMEAAENFLKQNYASKNNWAGKQEVADKFYEILSRRFS